MLADTGVGAPRKSGTSFQMARLALRRALHKAENWEVGERTGRERELENSFQEEKTAKKKKAKQNNKKKDSKCCTFSNRNFNILEAEDTITERTEKNLQY